MPAIAPACTAPLKAGQTGRLPRYCSAEPGTACSAAWNPTFEWVPSQNGLVVEAPQRQSAMTWEHLAFSGDFLWDRAAVTAGH